MGLLTEGGESNWNVLTTAFGVWDATALASRLWGADNKSKWMLGEIALLDCGIRRWELQ
jgi:hypothetical protein